MTDERRSWQINRVRNGGRYEAASSDGGQWWPRIASGKQRQWEDGPGDSRGMRWDMRGLAIRGFGSWSPAVGREARFRDSGHLDVDGGMGWAQFGGIGRSSQIEGFACLSKTCVRRRYPECIYVLCLVR